MRLQVIINDKCLIEYWKVYLWSIHNVLRHQTYRTKGGGTETWYWIEAIQNYGNNIGELVEIRLKDKEIKLLTTTKDLNID